MSKRLFHAIGLATALSGFLFFRLLPSTPPLSTSQDEYLQRTAAAKPAPSAVARVTPTAHAPVAEAKVPPAPATVFVPPALLAAMSPPTLVNPMHAAQDIPRVQRVKTARTVPPDPAAEDAVRRLDEWGARHGITAPQSQGVNARFPRHDVQPGEKTGGLNDIYGPQNQALDDFSKKTGRGG